MTGLLQEVQAQEDVVPWARLQGQQFAFLGSKVQMNGCDAQVATNVQYPRVLAPGRFHQLGQAIHIPDLQGRGDPRKRTDG